MKEYMNSHQHAPLTMPDDPNQPVQRPRLLSDADCRDIAQRRARYATGGGETDVAIGSVWTGTARWGRNRITSTGEDRDNWIGFTRAVRGASPTNVIFNEVSDAALVAAVRRAERIVPLMDEHVDYDALSRPDSP